MGTQRLGRSEHGGAARTVLRPPRVCTIAAPLLIVAASLDESTAVEVLFGADLEATLVGVFERAGGVDLRDESVVPRRAKPVPAVSLDRVRGDRQHTSDIAQSIADAIAGIEAATVAISLGLLGGDDLEASDAALLARRKSRSRIHWVCYAVGESGSEAAKVARRRMALFMRGIRLDAVAIAEAPLGSSARFWEIRAPHRY